MRRRLVLLLFVLLASGGLGALAPQDAHADPLLEVGPGNVSVQADTIEVDVAAKSAILTGNVQLQKGDLSVKCPRVDLKFDTTPHVTWIKGSGGVAADIRGVHAEAPEVELNLGKQILELRGGVKLSRGQGFIQADRATIDLSTAKVTAQQVKGSVPVPK